MNLLGPNFKGIVQILVQQQKNGSDCGIQLFRERLSEKVHGTTPKGIVGGFEVTVLQRNLKEWHERPWIYVFEC